MHILIIPVSYKSNFDGLSSPFFRDQALALREQGLKVGVICPLAITFKILWKSKRLSFKSESYNDNGVTTLINPFVSLPKFSKRTIRTRLKEGKKLFKQYILANGKPDIIHVHVFLAGELAIWIKDNYGIPYVVTEHSSNFERDIFSAAKIKLAHKVYKESNLNLAVSQSLSKSIKSKLNEIDFQIVPNIVDTDVFCPSEKPVFNKKLFKFISIGHLDSNKNHQFLIESFVKSFKGSKNVELIIIGDGVLRNKLESSIKAYDISSQITLFGAASRNQVVTMLQQSDCLVHTSKVETFGVVLIEAMACGLPVLATKSGGPESIISDSRLGILSEFDDFEKRLLEISKNKYNSEVVRKHIVDNFSSASISKKLIVFYNKLIK